MGRVRGGGGRWRGVGRWWGVARCGAAALGGAVVRGGAVRGGGEERCWFDGLEGGGVLGYLYWGGEGFAWGRGQEID